MSILDEYDLLDTATHVNVLVNKLNNIPDEQIPAYIQAWYIVLKRLNDEFKFFDMVVACKLFKTLFPKKFINYYHDVVILRDALVSKQYLDTMIDKWSKKYLCLANIYDEYNNDELQQIPIHLSQCFFINHTFHVFINDFFGDYIYYFLNNGLFVDKYKYKPIENDVDILNTSKQGNQINTITSQCSEYINIIEEILSYKK